MPRPPGAITIPGGGGAIAALGAMRYCVGGRTTVTRFSSPTSACGVAAETMGTGTGTTAWPLTWALLAATAKPTTVRALSPPTRSHGTEAELPLMRDAAPRA
ncbi:Uncharacterised protein [Mycobacteroides abscessus subsp. abscessus]|nr:Uncharacterised protein [Mycobacteroides abscessus subsp. abscessus]